MRTSGSRTVLRVERKKTRQAQLSPENSKPCENIAEVPVPVPHVTLLYLGGKAPARVAAENGTRSLLVLKGVSGRGGERAFGVCWAFLVVFQMVSGVFGSRVAGTPAPSPPALARPGR